MAPGAGVAPASYRLTGENSTFELPRNINFVPQLAEQNKPNLLIFCRLLYEFLLMAVITRQNAHGNSTSGADFSFPCIRLCS